jgi:hypothetical protein
MSDCVICGKHFVKYRPSTKTCSPTCRRESRIRYLRSYRLPRTKSERWDRIAAAYSRGDKVEVIMMDHGIGNSAELYKVVRRYGLPLRNRKQSEAIRAAMMGATA